MSSCCFSVITAGQEVK